MKKLSEQLKQFNPHSEIYQFDHFHIACTKLKKIILERLQQNIRINDYASMIVPGGTTPLVLFNLLATSNIPWNKVHICLSDERWVHVDHPDSNEHMIKQHLITHYGKEIHFTSLKTPHSTPDQAIDTCTKRFLSLPRPVDIVILGMGTDGHTASLFPETANIKNILSEQHKHYLTSVIPNHTSHPRISLTYQALMESKQLILLLKGEGKLKTLQNAFMDGSITHMPIRAFIKQAHVPLYIYWSP